MAKLIIKALLVVFLFAFPGNLSALPVKWPASHGLTTQQLEELLATAEITHIKDLKVGITKPKRLTLNDGKHESRAVFKYLSTRIKLVKGKTKRSLINNSDRYEYDIAAYRLDQLLDLNMTPPTVERRVNDTPGAVQFWIENAIVYKNIADNVEEALAGCDYTEQNEIMNMFDILIHNDDRNLGNVLFTQDSCRLWMIDHSKAFRVHISEPKNLKDIPIKLSEPLAQKLRALNKPELMKVMTELLDESQIDALLVRRDLILKKAVIH